MNIGKRENNFTSTNIPNHYNIHDRPPELAYNTHFFNTYRNINENGDSGNLYYNNNSSITNSVNVGLYKSLSPEAYNKNSNLTSFAGDNNFRITQTGENSSYYTEQEFKNNNDIYLENNNYNYTTNNDPRYTIDNSSTPTTLYNRNINRVEREVLEYKVEGETEEEEGEGEESYRKEMMQNKKNGGINSSINNNKEEFKNGMINYSRTDPSYDLVSDPVSISDGRIREFQWHNYSWIKETYHLPSKEGVTKCDRYNVKYKRKKSNMVRDLYTFKEGNLSSGNVEKNFNYLCGEVVSSEPLCSVGRLDHVFTCLDPKDIGNNIITDQNPIVLTTGGGSSGINSSTTSVSSGSGIGVGASATNNNISSSSGGGLLRSSNEYLLHDNVIVSSNNYNDNFTSNAASTVSHNSAPSSSFARPLNDYIITNNNTDDNSRYSNVSSPTDVNNMIISSTNLSSSSSSSLYTNKITEDAIIVEDYISRNKLYTIPLKIDHNNLVMVFRTYNDTLALQLLPTINSKHKLIAGLPLFTHTHRDVAACVGNKYSEYSYVVNGAPNSYMLYKIPQVATSKQDKMFLIVLDRRQYSNVEKTYNMGETNVTSIVSNIVNAAVNGDTTSSDGIGKAKNSSLLGYNSNKNVGYKFNQNDLLYVGVVNYNFQLTDVINNMKKSKPPKTAIVVVIDEKGITSIHVEDYRPISYWVHKENNINYSILPRSYFDARNNIVVVNTKSKLLRRYKSQEYLI